MRRAFVAAAAATVLSFVSSSEAYEIRPGVSSSGSPTSLGAGLKELGIESMFTVGYDKVGGSDAGLRANVFGGLAFRYFIIRNLSLGLTAGPLYSRVSVGKTVASDLGGYGLINIAYHASLGGGLFIVPTVGAGGFYAKRELEAPPAPQVESNAYGGLARGGLGLAFYASPRFMLHAGPEAFVKVGANKAKVEGASAERFIAVDAAFNVGLAYVF
jgi:hypothetical protein